MNEWTFFAARAPLAGNVALIPYLPGKLTPAGTFWGKHEDTNLDSGACRNIAGNRGGGAARRPGERGRRHGPRALCSAGHGRGQEVLDRGGRHASRQAGRERSAEIPRRADLDPES